MNIYKQEQHAKRQADLVERCKKLKKEGKKVEAVKQYRAAFGCGLRQAMQAVEAI